MHPGCKSLKNRLILNFSIVILVGGVLSVIIGVRLIGNTVIKQAQDKVRLDLNSAREVYLGEISSIEHTVRLTAERFFLKEAVRKGDRQALTSELERVRKSELIDILNLTDQQGYVIARARTPGVFGDHLLRESVEKVIVEKRTVSGVQIITGELLEKEGEEIARQARIKWIDTPYAYPRKAPDAGEEKAGMTIGAAAPIIDHDGKLMGVLYAEKLLNRSSRIVDKVKDIVYKGKKYKGKDIGTVTIFQQDLRISTNVRNEKGERAIGTRVSREVYDRVLLKGLPWIDRAFVVNDWYITAYEPLKNPSGKIIGILYVGILEAPYIDIRNHVIFDFLAIALFSVLLLTGTAYFTASRTTKPLKALTDAAKKVAQGDLSHRVRIDFPDETGQLAEAFNRMTIDLEKMTENYQELNHTLANRVREKTKELETTRDRLIQAEKLSSLGKMAAGVAHEINNPLTSILINAHLMAEELENEESVKENLKIIIDETTRCGAIVNDLLTFSRQTPPFKMPGNINNVVEKAVLLLKNQAALLKITVETDLAEGLPEVMMDSNKIEQVFTNVIVNALDAMHGGGKLSIKTFITEDEENRCFPTVVFRDEGSGIPANILKKVFDPFFSTKGVKGTGLGLSVSYGIVEQHGGRMEIRSEEGKGTEVTVYLPVKQQEEIDKKNPNNINNKEDSNDI
jgi:two-component system NtrC family sensor kinase